MRALAQPEVLKAAAVAASSTALVCYPRLSHAAELQYPTWYLEALAFLASMVLWSFVFAWHRRYTGRPVFARKFEPGLFVVATAAGLALASAWWAGLDPGLRVHVPAEYPATASQWFAHALFTLSFQQLFLVFAPFAWLMRLCRKVEPAVVMTVLFGVVVLFLRNRVSPLPPSLFLGMVVARVVTGFISVYFFLRGGVMLVWWLSLLIQSRTLLYLACVS